MANLIDMLADQFGIGLEMAHNIWTWACDKVFLLEIFCNKDATWPNQRASCKPPHYNDSYYSNLLYITELATDMIEPLPTPHLC